MRLPKSKPFVHFRFSDGAQILMTTRSRRKDAISNMDEIARRAAHLCVHHPDLCASIGRRDDSAIVTTQYGGSAHSWPMSHKAATEISRQVSAMLAEGE